MSAKIISSILVAGVLFAQMPAHADNHALVMGISAYPVSPLPGVYKDIESGREIARLIGVPEQNIVVRKDGDLSRSRLQETIDEFSGRIRQGDRVFVYFSGHGTSRSKAGQSGQCEKGLVTHDLQIFDKDTFHRTLNALAAKTDKAFVFLDSCFSGGLVQDTHSKSASRSFGEDAPRPKFSSSTPEDPCGKPSNLVSKATRDFGMESAARMPNYYLLSAASEMEVAFDGGPRRGSFATTSVLECLRETQRADANGDGSVTLDELRQCAQGRVNAIVQGSPGILGQTMAYGYGPGGNPAVSFAGGSQMINAAAFVRTLYEGRDATRNVSLRADKNPVRIGDYLNLEVVSDRPGYVTLMVVGSSGKIYQIFPNQMDGDARVDANRSMPIPKPEKWKMPANPPAGDNYFLALVSDTPDRFKGLGEQAGIFKAMGNSGNSAKSIIERMIQPTSGCANASRDFGMEAVNPCSTGYGAALIKVTEVN